MAKTVVAVRIDNEMLSKVMAVGGKDRSQAILKCIEAGVEQANAPEPGQLNLFSEDAQARANTQRQHVFEVMKDGKPRTISAIAQAIGARPESIPAIGARLRDFRKPKFGSHTVEKKEVRPGLFEYKLVI